MIKKFSIRSLLHAYYDTPEEVHEVRAAEGDRPNYRIETSDFNKLRIIKYIDVTLTNIIKQKNYKLLVKFYNLFLKYDFDDRVRKIIKDLEKDIIKIPDSVWIPHIKKTCSLSDNELDRINSGNEPIDLTVVVPFYDFIKIKEVKEIFDITNKKLLNLFNNFKTSSKMNIYDRNLEMLFNILNVTDKQKEFEYIKLDSNFDFVKSVTDLINPDFSYTYDFILSLFFKKNEIIKCSKNSLSLFNTNNKQFLYELLLNPNIRTKEDIINFICKLVTKNKLEWEDFYFIKQKNIIFNILNNGLAKHEKGINILFYGKPGTGKTELAYTLIQKLGVIGYSIDAKNSNDIELYSNSLRRLNVLDQTTDDSESRKGKLLLMLEMVKNSKSVVLFDEAEDFFRTNTFNKASQSKFEVNKILEENNVPIIWTTNDISCMEESYLRRFNYILEFSEIPTRHLENIVDKIADKRKVKLNDKAKSLILTRRPNLGIIDNALKTYKLVNSNNQEDLNMILTDMINNSTFHSGSKVKINKSEFLPELLNTSENLEEIANQIIKSGQLDFSILSYGCSGASKTSFARYLAEKLGIDVIYKSYSELSSCWVGETEKELQRLFDKATQEKSMIILDEADVLLMDRSKARNSWEKSQTEALLTAMEDHEYPFIMTTNLFEDLDSACMRRFDFKIKHDYLKEEQVKIALKHFFNIDLNYDSKLTKITPGDFVTVKKQIRFLPKLSEQEILEKLEQECKNKKDYSRTIGF